MTSGFLLIKLYNAHISGTAKAARPLLCKGRDAFDVESSYEKVDTQKLATLAFELHWWPVAQSRM
jgi:hypothetical protein